MVGECSRPLGASDRKRRRSWWSAGAALLSVGLVLPFAGASCGDSSCDDAADSDADGLGDCKESERGADPAVADTDGDGLDDGVELGLGTNPAVADTDGDGQGDGAEVECHTSPTDPNEACYACGWMHNDPGSLVSKGAEVGDVIQNYELVDPCGERVELWDFARSYHILYMTAAW